MTESIIAFLNLTLLEVVLGIDNVLFISILSERLPKEKQELGRKLGLFIALFARILLLLSLKWMMNLGEKWLNIFQYSFSTRDIILIAGGIFLLFKSSSEIFHFVEKDNEQLHKEGGKLNGIGSFLFQVGLVDLVFSLDSVITAIGLVKQMYIMISAIIVSVFVMILFSEKLNSFIKQHAALRLLALSFLIVVGVVLVAEGFGEHIPKGYIYFGMGFTLFVELLNIRRLNKMKNLKSS